MAKKGRRSAANTESNGFNQSYDASKSKLRLDSWEDVADEVDHFHADREKILLEKSGYEDDEDSEASDEEVMALDLTSDEEDDSEDSDEGDGEDDEEDDDSEAESKDEKPKRQSKKSKANDDDSDDDEILGKKVDDSEDEGWGQNKRDYYGANELETEEDAKREEEEARKIQASKLAAMKASDFMFDEDEWAAPEDEKAKGEQGDVVVEELPEAAIPEDPKARLELLKARHPEFEPLSKDFVALQEEHQALARSAAAEEAVGEVGVATTKFRALSTYLGVLGLYFAVLTSDEAVATKGKSVREHGVMEGIVRAKKVWDKARALVDDKIGGSPLLPVQNGKMKTKAQAKAAPAPAKKSKSKSKISQEMSDSESEPEVESISQRRSLLPERIVSVSAQTKAKKSVSFNEYTDEAPDLDNPLAASRRRALNFHATQLTTKSNKRRSAVVSGDSDIPHKERLREKQERLRREVEKKRLEAGADLDENDSGSEDDSKSKKRARDEDEEYYDMVANAGKKRKADRDALFSEFKASEKAEIALLNKDSVDDGKRAINYQIEKNKGLTPHRKKENRNPRVKKRMKYEKAKKKLGSKRAVYKAPTGAYGGELTGIKGGLVKSRKLG